MKVSEERNSKLTCENGHLLSEYFGSGSSKEEVDIDYVVLAINAGLAFESIGCKSCKRHADLLKLKYSAELGEL